MQIIKQILLGKQVHNYTIGDKQNRVKLSPNYLTNIVQFNLEGGEGNKRTIGNIAVRGLVGQGLSLALARKRSQLSPA